MDELIKYLPFIPFVGLILAFLPENKNENLIFRITIVSILLHFLGILILVTEMARLNSHFITSHGWEIYTSGTSDFSIKFFLDRYGAVYSLISAVITLLVCMFSKYYIHREKGFKRFFNNMLFFYGGLQMILLSGNFETLFIGWEILGVTSFFLICFYKDRYLPVKNSFKVFSVYRIADISLLLGLWLSHHIHHQSIAFEEMSGLTWTESHQAHQSVSWIGYIIPFVFLIAVMVKSAQFPFSSWLPRAMEGPTSSSAVFYGSLSVHIGIFLLIRIHPIWEHNSIFKIVLILIGLITSLVGTSIARVQSTVKTQIAYSSITQIGLMMIEVALGWFWVALVHFMANAFLRCYQLLVSPSVLSYKIHDQFFNFIKPQHSFTDNLWGRLKMTLFVLGIKEWNLDTLMYRYLWRPLKISGRLSSLLINKKSVIFFFTPLLVLLLYFTNHKQVLPSEVTRFLPEILSLISLLLILTAFVLRGSAYIPWFLVLFSQMYMALSISFNEKIGYDQVFLYLSGLFVAGIIGFICIKRLERNGEPIHLDTYHGLSLPYPNTGLFFIFACLGLAGFPNSPTFIGEDLMLGHIHENQLPLTLITALNLILDGLVVFRIYSRLFLGPHERGEVAFKSS